MYVPARDCVGEKHNRSGRIGCGTCIPPPPPSLPPLFSHRIIKRLAVLHHVALQLGLPARRQPINTLKK